MSSREDIGRTVEMPYLTWKAIEQQVETLTEDRVARNARIRDLEAERDDLADALRAAVDDLDLLRHSRATGTPARNRAEASLIVARAALDRHTHKEQT